MKLKEKLDKLDPLYRERHGEFFALLSSDSETLRGLAMKSIVWTDVSLKTAMDTATDLPAVLNTYKKNMDKLAEIDAKTIAILKEAVEQVRGPFPEIYAGNAAFALLYAMEGTKTSENIGILHTLCLEMVEINVDTMAETLLRLYRKDETEKIIDALLGMATVILHVMSHLLGVVIAGGEKIIGILNARRKEVKTTDTVLAGLEEYQENAMKFCLTTQLFRLSIQAYAKGEKSVPLEVAQEGVNATIKEHMDAIKAKLESHTKAKH